MLKRLTAADASQVYPVYRRALEDNGHFVTRIWSQSEWRQIYNASQCVAEIGAPGGGGSAEVIQAFVLYRDLPSAWDVVMLATDPYFQKSGIMTRLLHEWMQQCGREKPIWLEVHIKNSPAIALYRKLGFQEVGVRPRYYADGGTALCFSFPT